MQETLAVFFKYKNVGVASRIKRGFIRSEPRIKAVGVDEGQNKKELPTAGLSSLLLLSSSSPPQPLS